MSPRSGSRARSRLGITPEAIVQSAAELLVEHGLSGLTMRRVSDALGIGTMTLYGYFRDKDELLDAVVDMYSSQVDIPRSSGPWKNRLRDLMLTLHAQLVEHPFLVDLRLQRPLASAGALRWTEVGLEILVDAGFSPGRAAAAFRPLFVYTFGHALFLPRQDPDRVQREARAAIALLPPEQYPNVIAASSELSGSITGEESYRYGLERLIDGIAASA